MLLGARDLSEMTPLQRATYDMIAAGPRGGVPFPFLAMLDAPNFAEAIQSVGEAIRFHGQLSDRLREVAILSAAAAYGSGYEWGYHEKIARDLGLGDAELDGIRSGTGADLSEVERASVQFIFSAVLERRADHQLLERLVALLDRTRATEIVTIAGYYPLLALFLAAGGLDTTLVK